MNKSARKGLSNDQIDDLRVRRPRGKETRRLLMEKDLAQSAIAYRMPVEITVAMARQIDDMFVSGMWGASREAVVEEVLRGALRELELKGRQP